MERNKGLERILHKFKFSVIECLASRNLLEEFLLELDDVGEIFEKIHETQGFNKEQEKALSHIEFVIIKSIASHISLKYEIIVDLKYPDLEIQEYFKKIKPLSVSDLLNRCRIILKKNDKLKRVN